MLLTKQQEIMNNKVLLLLLATILLVSHSVCFSQNKLTRNQILNAVRSHQQNGDSIVVTSGDSVRCDSTTTKITLEVLNDSAMHYYSYKLTFTKDDIEVDIYNSESNLYRSTFEYTNSSFEKLKSKINKYNLRKIDSYDDTIPSKANHVLRLYRRNKAYLSVESYNGRTNVTSGFHGLVKYLKGQIADVKSALSICEEFDTPKDTLVSDTVVVSLSLSEETVRFKSKGGEFKKVKVICDTEDWEVIECPEWITLSKNKNSELVLESSKNESKNTRTGIVKVACLGDVKEIIITQF